jgi:hypothetical protein
MNYNSSLVRGEFDSSETLLGTAEPNPARASEQSMGKRLIRENLKRE